MNREQADEIAQRVAVLALMYYPEIHADDPEYSLRSDLEFSLDTGVVLEDADRAAITDLISRTIIDPTGHREALLSYLYGLVDEQAEGR